MSLRAGAPDMASSLWIGPPVARRSRHPTGQPVPAELVARRRHWIVIFGANVVRVMQDAPRAARADSGGLDRGPAKFPGAMTELQLSRDGTRAAMVIDGRVILATVEQTPGGGYALTYPRRLGFGLGDSAVSLSWRTGDDIVASRNDAPHPVSYVNLDGVNSDGPERQLLPR